MTPNALEVDTSKSPIAPGPTPERSPALPVADDAVNRAPVGRQASLVLESHQPVAPTTGLDQTTKRAVEFAVPQSNTSVQATNPQATATGRDRVRQTSALLQTETTASPRTADVAGLVDDSPAVALPNQTTGWKKLLLDAYKQQVSTSEEKVGIKDAKAETVMPTLLSTPFLNLAPSAPVVPVAEAASSFPAEWAEKLAQLTSRAERLAPARLEVSLPMEGAKDLRVRVSCRGGQISCEFHNVSSEMQRVFMREWPGLSQLFGRDTQLRVEQPTFVNLTDPQNRGGDDQSNRRQRDERAARNEDADIAAFFSAQRKPTGRAA